MPITEDIVNRTYGRHKKLYIPLLLLATLGPTRYLLCSPGGDVRDFYRSTLLGPILTGNDEFRDLEIRFEVQ